MCFNQGQPLPPKKAVMGVSTQVFLVSVIHATLVQASPLDAVDLRRARTKVPRQPWRASDPGASMNALLNKHLLRRFDDAQACETWTSTGVQNFLKTLHPHVSLELGRVYDSTSDRRDGSSARPSLPLHEHEKQWKELDASAADAGGIA